MGTDIFLHGFLLGIGSAFVFGFLSKRVQGYRGKIGKKNKPFDTFPDAAQPKLTSAKVYRESSWARIWLVFWFIVLLIAVMIIIYMVQIRIEYFSTLC
ncbi:MAG: hypothetical protein HN736_01250 [Anaerolineae bacterium]|jgi:hypothetical protein|nr:hypothetical protein [Anaerolineae bacterium]MBT4310255.1 hypothetical protein [Anaerolineae bacterium]MBT4460239.1 hypothetical protein [Anaerolineae bacterium]MBT4842166.1 hypothetical protein [Anaerolineae bacterium]MBT6063094.1 hypothetical protein [Anaerolineae bacterium]